MTSYASHCHGNISLKLHCIGIAFGLLFRERDRHLLPLDSSHYNARIPGSRELMSGFGSWVYLSHLCTQ